jgi:hypothetical protein
MRASLVEENLFNPQLAGEYSGGFLLPVIKIAS